MNLDIKDNIRSNLKGSSKKEIISTIEDGIESNDEIVLPGLGVLLTLFWGNLSKDEKEKIAVILESKLK